MATSAPEHPVRVSVQGPPLICAAVASVAAAHPDRLTVVAAGGRDDEVGVVDPSSADLRTSRSSLPVVALVRDGDLLAAARARAAGAVRVLPLSVDAGSLLSVLELTARHDGDLAGPVPSRRDTSRKLSPREAEVVAAICRGSSNEQIARELFLSINSVKTYVRCAYRKMGVQRRSQAVLWGLDRDL